MGESDSDRLLLRLQAWHERSRSMVGKAARIPDIDCRPLVIHDEGDYSESSVQKAIRDALEQHILSEVDQRLARFSVLRFYYTISEPNEEDWEPDDVEEIKNALHQDFSYFLDFPPSPTEIEDSEELTWELRQAWLARYWSRVEVISDRLKSRRGEANSVADLRLARLLWAGVPRPSMPLELAAGETWFQAAGWLGPFARNRTTSVQERGWLRKAAMRIKGAFDMDQSVRAVYRGILADCYACSGEFLLAAREWEEHGQSIAIDGLKEFLDYRRSLGEPVADEIAGAFGDLERRSYTAWCLDQAGRQGDRERAIMVLEKALEKYPETPQLHRELATYLMRENRVQEAAQHVARERELTPDNEDWCTTFGELASLAAYVMPDKLKEDYLQSKSAGLQMKVIREAVDAHWEMFRRMAPEAQDLWTRGSFWLFGEQARDACPESLGLFEAGTSLGKAVELELRRTVFSPFKLANAEALRPDAKANHEPRLSDWCTFLLKDDWNPNLGTMREFLRMAHDTPSRLLKPFEEWLIGSFEADWRDLTDRKWDGMVRLRNQNTHSTPLQLREAREFHRYCQAYLDRLLRIVYVNPKLRARRITSR